MEKSSLFIEMASAFAENPTDKREFIIYSKKLGVFLSNDGKTLKTTTNINEATHYKIREVYIERYHAAYKFGEEFKVSDISEINPNKIFERSIFDDDSWLMKPVIIVLEMLIGVLSLFTSILESIFEKGVFVVSVSPEN